MNECYPKQGDILYQIEFNFQRIIFSSYIIQSTTWWIDKLSNENIIWVQKYSQPHYKETIVTNAFGLAFIRSVETNAQSEYVSKLLFRIPTFKFENLNSVLVDKSWEK